MWSWFVKANDIINWTKTNKRRAEEILPLLVKRLILASCKPQKCEFSSGDSINIGGWDGIVDVDKGNQHVPDGASGWECGTDEKVKTKADRDYNKRTKKPHPLTREQSTFVFVSTRRWSKKNTWIKEKALKGKWKDIRGINADDLESWLEVCPSVHRWFARIVGKRNGSLRDLEQAWAELSNSTRVALKPDLFVNSRGPEQEKLYSYLAGNGIVTRIRAESMLDAYGFILSSLIAQEEYAIRTLIVTNQDTWNWLIGYNEPLILIPHHFAPRGIGAANFRGHHVLLAIDKSHTGRPSIELSRMSRSARISAIQSLGFAETAAEKIYTDTRGYFEPILRHKELCPLDSITVEWTTTAQSDTLFAALFSTEWENSSDNDRNIMSVLSGIEYNSFEKQVFDLAKYPDPPIRLVGNIWQVVAKIDMWSLIAPGLTETHLNRLDKAISQLFPDLDPSFDLAPEERPFAGIKNAIPIYSEHIKSGIADTLALIATEGDKYAEQAGAEKPSNFVAWWVKRIFQNSVEARIWYSLRDNLPLIAEAAPDEFLEAVERSIQGNEPVIVGIFNEGKGIFSGCPHAGLLWALEGISWNKSFWPRVCTSLARLAQLAPANSNWSNTPLNSLINIFLGWTNNTAATHGERLEIIKKVMIPHYPDVAWDLMIALIKKPRISDPIHKPRRTDWADSIDRNVSKSEYLEYNQRIFQMALEEVRHSPANRIMDLISNFLFLDWDQREDVIDFLDAFVENFEDAIKDKITHELRKYISLLSKGESSPRNEHLSNKMREIYSRIETDDLVRNNAYLFDGYFLYLLDPDQPKLEDHKARKVFYYNKRREALDAIYSKGGVEDVRRLIVKCNNPRQLGIVLANSSFTNQIVSDVMNWFNEEGHLRVAADNYVWERTLKHPDWGRAFLVANKDFHPAQKALILQNFPPMKQTIDLVESQDAETQSKYWRGLTHYYGYDDDVQTISHVAVKLMEHDRPLAALDALGQLFLRHGAITGLDSKLVADILLKTATYPSDTDHMTVQHVHHEILQAIAFIQDRAELAPAQIAHIELLYINLFRFEKIIKPRYLFEEVTSDPKLFIELINWSIGRTEKEDFPQEILSAKAQIGWEILYEISFLPGADGTGIDGDKLDAWINEVRNISGQSDISGLVDDRIGSYLSRYPAGDDGVWPHEAVRRVIERVKSDKLDLGMITGKRNLMGLTSRLIFEGGVQEREVATNYNSDATKIALVYPRTASILRKLARDYEKDAIREDRWVELLE